MINFEELIELGKFERVGDHLSVGGVFPYSITESEANYIRDLIIKNKLKRGYELATGTGISALAAGLGFKKTGGKLVSLDSYIESHVGKVIYDKTDETYPDSEGYEMALFLKEKYDIPVEFELGWSPDDVPDILATHFKDKLDYVFIDGQHTRSSILDDIYVLRGLISKGFMLFHDVSRKDVLNAVNEGVDKYIKKGAKINLVMPNLGVAKI